MTYTMEQINSIFERVNGVKPQGVFVPSNNENTSQQDKSLAPKETVRIVRYAR